MKPATLKALNASIAHWERLVKNGPSQKEKIGPDSCALCGRFHPFHEPPCQRYDGEQCPVFANTGFTNCDGTPYLHVFHLTDGLIATLAHGVTLDRWRTEARRELAFLKSLLPKT